MTQEIKLINIENYRQDAIEAVSAWELPQADLATAIMDQAYLMIGANIDDIRNYPSDDC